MEQKFKLFSRAFTLAEVLMVLVIIGIISAMVMPILVKSSNDAEFKARWKKNYSVFAEASKLLEIENGPLVTLCENPTGENIGVNSIDDCIRDKFLEKVKYQKKCDRGKVYGDCFIDTAALKYVNCANGGKYNIEFWQDDAGAILADGTSVVFWTWGVTEAGADWGSRIIFDLNGRKGPNTIGKDILMLKLVNGQLRPAPIGDYTPWEAQYSGTTPQNCGWDNSTKILYGE